MLCVLVQEERDEGRDQEKKKSPSFMASLCIGRSPVKKVFVPLWHLMGMLLSDVYKAIYSLFMAGLYLSLIH